MTAPRFKPCRCTHDKRYHDQPGMAPQCTAPSCTCLAYRPDVSAAPPAATPPVGLRSIPATPPTISPAAAPPPPVAPPATEQRTDVDKLLFDAKQAGGRHAKLADRISGLIHDLRHSLTEHLAQTEARAAEERARAAARARIAKLERELAEARAALRGPTTASAPSARAHDGVCPECGRTGLGNVGVHRARAHGQKAG